MPRLFDYSAPHVGCFDGPIKMFFHDICVGNTRVERFQHAHTHNGVGRHQRVPWKLLWSALRKNTQIANSLNSFPSKVSKHTRSPQTVALLLTHLLLQMHFSSLSPVSDFKTLRNYIVPLNNLTNNLGRGVCVCVWLCVLSKMTHIWASHQPHGATCS